MAKRALFGLRINRAAMYILFFACGTLAGIILVAFAPGAPWSTTIEPSGAKTVEALDLAAQRSMAAAAWWMVGIAGTGGIVGGLSLLLILHTLRAAQRSAVAAEATVAETRSIGRAQTRAYLSIGDITLNPDENIADIAVEIRNVGQSPARAMSLRIVIDIDLIDINDVRDDSPHFVETYTAQARPHVAGEATVQRVPAWDFDPGRYVDEAIPLGADANFTFRVFVSFTDVFDDEWEVEAGALFLPSAATDFGVPIILTRLQ